MDQAHRSTQQASQERFPISAELLNEHMGQEGYNMKADTAKWQ
jgi:hypothetical protein